MNWVCNPYEYTKQKTKNKDPNTEKELLSKLLDFSHSTSIVMQEHWIGIAHPRMTNNKTSCVLL